MTAARIVPVDVRNPDPFVITEAADALHEGRVVALPTDTVYGLSCDPYDESALAALRTLKGHFEERPYVVLFDGSDEWLARLVSQVPEAARRLMTEHWPGPLTIVLPAARGAPVAAVSERGAIALRHARHAVVASLVNRFSAPIVSTSANRAGLSPLGSAAEIAREFGDPLRLVLDGGSLVAAAPSTVVDATQTELRVLRHGAVTLS